MKDDPIKRFVEHDLPVAGMPLSPMEPPEATAPPSIEAVEYADLKGPLKQLWDEHEDYLKVLAVLDNALIALRENSWLMTPEISTGIKHFFQYVDERASSHNNKEERALFPVLREKLIEAGECSPGEDKTTPVDVMEEEHDKVGQSAAIMFTLLGLAPRVEDEKIRNMLFDHACNLGQEIVETMKLHIFRENNIIFPLAQKLIADEDWDSIHKKMKRY